MTRYATQLGVVRLLLLFAVIITVHAEEMEEEDDDFIEDDIIYVKSWSWAIFAIFMWLVPQLSILVGDYRESLFSSKTWNVPATGSERDAFYTNKKNKTKTSSTTEEDDNADKTKTAEEEGPLYDKGNVVMSAGEGAGGVDDDDDDDDDSASEEEGEDTAKKQPASLRAFVRGGVQDFVKVFSAPALIQTTTGSSSEEKKKKSVGPSAPSPKLLSGMKAVRQAAGMTIVGWLFLIVVAAIGISLGTTPLDERMILVLEGLSRVFGAVIMSVVSFTVPFWSGLYVASYSDRKCNLGNGSLKELRFQVRWALHRPLFTCFVFMLPFFCGVTDAKIPVSIVSGIATGFIVDASVYFARRFQSRFRRMVAIGLFTAIFGMASAFVMGDGAWFIANVWTDEGDYYEQGVIFFCVAMGWCIMLFVAHMIRLMYSRRHRRHLERTLGPDEAMVDHSTSANPTAAARPRMATSLIMGRMKGGTMSNAHDLEGTRGWESRQRVDDKDDDEEEGSKNPSAADNKNGAPTSLTSIREDGGQQTTSAQLLSEGIGDSAAGFEDEIVQARKSSDIAREGEDDVDDEPTYKELFCNFTCCGCVRRSDNKTWLDKLIAFTTWTVWWILVLGALFVVAVNLGSTYQQEAARAKLPYVVEVLYDNMDEGPVCAFDNKGPESNITTFPDKEAANAEGFLVVHCGECAACSDWHNLRLEYTTREYLAKESARCARKSLTGGADAVTRCLEKPPIGFQGQCAVCWTEDILCTKGFCAMIFLQSIMINTVGNFAVGPDTITSASCEEAHCEAGNPGDFVYCSGATRRRMNVTSSIARPGAQQCGIVDVEWAEVFPE